MNEPEPFLRVPAGSGPEGALSADPTLMSMHEFEAALRSNCRSIQSFLAALTAGKQLESAFVSQSLVILAANRSHFRRMLIQLLESNLDVTPYRHLLAKLDLLFRTFWLRTLP